jgi:hypothetical protein
LKKLAINHIRIQYLSGKFTRVPKNKKEAAAFKTLMDIGMFFVKGVKPLQLNRKPVRTGISHKKYRIYYYCESTFRQSTYIVKPVIFLDVVKNPNFPMFSFYMIHTHPIKKKKALCGSIRNAFLDHIGNDPFNAVENMD